MYSGCPDKNFQDEFVKQVLLPYWVNYIHIVRLSELFEWHTVQWVCRLHSIVEWPVLRQVVHWTACRKYNSSIVGKLLCSVDIFILFLPVCVWSMASTLSITWSIDWFLKLNTARVVQRGSRIASRNISFNSSFGILFKIWSCKFWNRITNCEIVSCGS